MAKKRLIFTLLFDNGSFVLSRNFRLQHVGDIDWLEKNYGFSNVGFSIDELIVLDVSREPRHETGFLQILKALNNDCFAPISAGGGIASVSSARNLLRSGADKIVVNSAVHQNKQIIFEIAKEFGHQCVVVSIDCKKMDNDFYVVIENGSKILPLKLNDFLLQCRNLPCGEIYLNSIDRDGTGFGYELNMLNCVPDSFDLPLIIAGGVGNHSHLAEGLLDPRVDAVATANLLNFIGNGLEISRSKLIESGIDLPVFKNIKRLE